MKFSSGKKWKLNRTSRTQPEQNVPLCTEKNLKIYCVFSPEMDLSQALIQITFNFIFLYQGVRLRWEFWGTLCGFGAGPRMTLTNVSAVQGYRDGGGAAQDV